MVALLWPLPWVIAPIAAWPCWRVLHEQPIGFVPARLSTRAVGPASPDRPLTLVHDCLRKGLIPRRDKPQPPLAEADAGPSCHAGSDGRGAPSKICRLEIYHPGRLLDPPRSAKRIDREPCRRSGIDCDLASTAAGEDRQDRWRSLD